MQTETNNLTGQRHVIQLEAIQPSSLTVKKAIKGEFGKTNERINLGVFGNFCILAHENQHWLDPSDKHQYGNECAQDAKAASLKYHTCHKIFAIANILRNECFDRAVQTDERLEPEKVHDHGTETNPTDHVDVL